MKDRFALEGLRVDVAVPVLLVAHDSGVGKLTGRRSLFLCLISGGGAKVEIRVDAANYLLVDVRRQVND